MSAAAAGGQSGHKRLRSSEGQDNTTHAGSRGGAGPGPSAASPPPSSYTCVTDSFRAAAVTACTKAVYKLTGAKKKAYGFKQSVATLEKHMAEGTVPVTLRVELPKAYKSHVGSPSMEAVACVNNLQKRLISDSLEVKREKQALAESEFSNPMAVFEREYSELVHCDKLPPDLLETAKAVFKDQGEVFRFAWIKADADFADKAEQKAASRTAAAEAAAQANMEIEALPSRELIEDLVTKRVAAALMKERAHASTSAPATAGGGDGKGKAKSKAKPDSAQRGTQGSNKGKQKPKQHAKGQKNASRK